MEPRCLNESSFGDLEYVLVKNRPVDSFHLQLIFPLSRDVKPSLDLSNASLAIRPAMSNSVNVVDIVQDIPSSLDLIVTPPISFNIVIQNKVNV